MKALRRTLSIDATHRRWCSQNVPRKDLGSDEANAEKYDREDSDGAEEDGIPLRPGQGREAFDHGCALEAVDGRGSFHGVEWIGHDKDA